MTLTEMLADLRIILQEPSANKYTDTQLKRYLQEASHLLWNTFCLRTNVRSSVQKATAQSIVAGTQEYSLPTDMVRFMGIERVGVEIPYFLTKIDITEKSLFGSGNYRQSAYPKLFYLNRPYFGIVPIPGEAIADALQVHYVKREADLGDSASPSIPSEFHYLIPIRAAMKALRVDETSPGELKVEWHEGLAQMIHDYHDDGEAQESGALSDEY